MASSYLKTGVALARIQQGVDRDSAGERQQLTLDELKGALHDYLAPSSIKTAEVSEHLSATLLKRNLPLAERNKLVAKLEAVIQADQATPNERFAALAAYTKD